MAFILQVNGRPPDHMKVQSLMIGCYHDIIAPKFDIDTIADLNQYRAGSTIVSYHTTCQVLMIVLTPFLLGLYQMFTMLQTVFPKAFY